VRPEDNKPASDSAGAHADVVRDQLERLLADSRFVRSERLSRLLRYTVEKTLAGDGEQLKEYAIALEVYGKPPSYDPAVDSLVRVEVTRLRNKLLEYYATNGRDDRVRIEVPKGTYVPVFISQVAPEPLSHALRRRFLIMWGVPGCLVAGIAGWLFTTRRAQPGVEPSPSVVVLPFSNFSSDPESNAFAAGLTEDVTNALSRAGVWRVASRAAALPFQTRPDTVASIGRQLHVTAVLIGTVRKEAAHLRITAHLINVADGYYVWSETWDRDTGSTLAIQTELSELIARTLSIQRQASIRAGSPPEREARAAVRRGRDLIEQDTEDHLVMGSTQRESRSLPRLMTAIQHFERAIALDPQYAPAFAGLARAWTLAADFDERSLQNATQAAQRGLRIDDRLPEAHFVLASGKFLREWDLPGAALEFKRTLELNPRDVTAGRLYADCSALLGDWNSGFAALHSAQQLVPGSPVLALQVGIMLYHARRFDELLSYARLVSQKHPDLPQVHWLSGLALEQKRQYKDAAAEFEICLRFAPRDMRATPALGHVYGLLGRRNDVMRLIDAERDRGLKEGLGPTAISLMYLGLGDKESTIGWLAKAYEIREPAFLYVRLDPRFDSLQSDPRYASLLQRLSF
jgi:TolB-like protein/cytochrome c-type biogenesis protein CcmH/NrfG